MRWGGATARGATDRDPDRRDAIGRDMTGIGFAAPAITITEAGCIRIMILL